MADVLISYKRENQGAVQRLVQGLRSAGFNVWWDQDIPPDAPWEATIERELEKAKVVVVAWSRAAAASENVKAEARRARTQGKLIQTFVEPCDPPLFFGERQGIDLTTWDGAVRDNRFLTLVASVKAVLGGRRPPDGVGYRPRRGSPLPAVTGVAVLASAIVGIVANFGGARDALCSIEALSAICAQQGLLTAAAGSETTNEAAPPATQQAAPQEAAPRRAAGVEYELEIPTGSAIDLDAGTVSPRVVAGSDFVLVDNGDGSYFIDHVADPAGTRPDTGGRPLGAICAPGEYYYRSYLAGQGEYNCFKTLDGREGAIIRRPDRRGFDGVIITYRFWE